MNKVISIFRPFVLAIFILFLFNRMAESINMYIPINIVTIFIVGLFKIPGLMLLIVLKFII